MWVVERENIIHKRRFALVAAISVLFTLTGCGGNAAKATDSSIGVAHLVTPAPLLPTVVYDQRCGRTAASTVAIERCESSELRAVQGQLDAAVASVKRIETPSAVEVAQGTFSTYENAEGTASVTGYQGGSIYPAELAACEGRLTVERLQEVREVLRTAPS